MGLIAKKCFPNTKKATDRFHVQKLALEALQEISIKFQWLLIDQENEAIEKAKQNKKRNLRQRY
jgi:transposase